LTVTPVSIVASGSASSLAVPFTDASILSYMSSIRACVGMLEM
jgi:hypothetical protein